MVYTSDMEITFPWAASSFSEVAAVAHSSDHSCTVLQLDCQWFSRSSSPAPNRQQSFQKETPRTEAATFCTCSFFGGRGRGSLDSFERSEFFIQQNRKGTVFFQLHREQSWLSVKYYRQSSFNHQASFHVKAPIGQQERRDIWLRGSLE